MMNSGSVWSGNGDQVLEACHEQRRQDLVQGDDSHRCAGRRRGACRLRAQARCCLVRLWTMACIFMCAIAQLVAAVALKQAVDEHEGAEVGAHPAVFPEALEARDRSGGDHRQPWLTRLLSHCAVVDHGVLHAAPLALFGDAGLVIVAGALTADTVLGLPDGVEALAAFCQ